MISVLIRQILIECDLKQRELAELLDVPLQRVKRLVGGEAKKLKREEGEALIKKLNIRADWLATGEGPMFQSDNEQELLRRMSELSDATRKANLEALPEDKRLVLQEILFAVEVGDVDTLLRNLQAPIPEEESELLDLYRHAPLAVKGAVLGALAAGNTDAAGQSITDNSSGNVSFSVSGNGNKVAGKNFIKK